MTWPPFTANEYIYMYNLHSFKICNITFSFCKSVNCFIFPPLFHYLASPFMASNENNDMSLVEMDLEVFEIDGALLRELLEDEEEGKGENDHGNVECVVESLKENNVNPTMMEKEQEQKQENCLDKCECYSTYDFEWLSMMDIMEPTNVLNEVRLNCFSDDIVGMLDFGYANDECYSQICGGLGSNEASYGYLWEDYDI